MTRQLAVLADWLVGNRVRLPRWVHRDASAPEGAVGLAEVDRALHRSAPELWARI